MPELPEVETIYRDLEQTIAGQLLKECRILRPDYIRNTDADVFIENIVGQILESLQRRGKYILMNFGSGIILAHLGMTGKFITANGLHPLPKHAVAVFQFDNAIVLMEDIRRFGRLNYYRDKVNIPELESLGVEPLSTKLTVQYLLDKFRNRTRSIKELLLDQGIIAGLGNIYVSEILFRSRIHPLTPGGKLSSRKIDGLVQNTKDVLIEAIKNAGTTISDYRRVDDKSGGFQDFLKVYGKEGDSCPVCSRKIERITFGGRSSFFCPKCQKL